MKPRNLGSESSHGADMASPSYAGEDEIDYEDEDYGRDGLPAGAMEEEEGEGARDDEQGDEEEEEEEEDGDYDDLYSDVNVGFFPDPGAAVPFDSPPPDDGLRSGQPAPAAGVGRGEGGGLASVDGEIRVSQDLGHGESSGPVASASARGMNENDDASVAISQEEGVASVKEKEESLMSLDHEVKSSEQAAAVVLPSYRVSPAPPDHGLPPGEVIPSQKPPAAGLDVHDGGTIPRGADESTRQDGTVSPWNGVSNGRTGLASHPASTSPSPMAAAADKTASSPAHDYPGRGSSRSGDGGNTRLLVTDLHWWTTDAELEAALSEYGRLKSIKFFEERASGKSKGYCQIEFCDASAAQLCVERMNGQQFNGRPCVVCYSSSYIFRQLNAGHDVKTQPPQTYNQGRRMTMDTGRTRSSSVASQGGKMGMGGRNQGPSSGRTVQGTFKGRGGLGSRNMGTGGGGGTSALGYGQVNAGTMAGPAVPPHGMMAQGYESTYVPVMGRGASGYGGYVPRGPTYAGIGLPYPTITPAIFPGIAPHVNPAFFGRSSNMNGMGMLIGNSVEGAGGWGDAALGGWGNEERDQRIRENSYGEESGGSDMGYHESGRLGSIKEKGRDGERGSYGERRHREERDADWEREKPRERRKDQDREDDDYERERYARTRNKPRSNEDDEQRSRLREEDYGKRRRVPR